MNSIRQSQSGSILVEGVIIVFTLVLTIVFNLELFRRMNYETLVHLSAFIRARDKVMGVKLEKSRNKICTLFYNALPEGTTLCENMNLEEMVQDFKVKSISEEIINDQVTKNLYQEEGIKGIVASSHIEYQQLMKFDWENPRNHYLKENKKDLEITKQCPYPTSSY